MPPKRKPVPSYVEHKQSGRGRAVWYDAAGVRQQRLLPGAFRSPESVAAYGKLLLELAVAPVGPSLTEKRRANLTVNEVLLAYLEHAGRYYRGADGRPTTPLVTCRLVIRSLRELYGGEPAAEFGPLKLKAVREGWVAAGLSRGEVNRRAGVVKRIFKWAVSEQLVPAATWQALTAVSGLKRGRTGARDPEPVGPVDDAVVDATLPHLSRQVRGLVEFQRLTGCRPGEACQVRRSDIDATGPVWMFRPARHKTAHAGKTRAVAVGPRAQELLKQFFTDDPADYLFSPARAMAELYAGRAANRKTPFWPSRARRNETRRKKMPKQKPSDKYTRGSYSCAVTRACDAAFPPPAALARSPGETAKAWKARLTPGQVKELAAWRKAHRWHPNQLRHTFATKVRKAHGPEAAQVTLGHSRADVTQIYAEKNEALATAIAAEIG